MCSGLCLTSVSLVHLNWNISVVELSTSLVLGVLLGERTAAGFMDTQDVFVDTSRGGEHFPSVNKQYVRLCCNNEERDFHIYFYFIWW